MPRVVFLPGGKPAGRVLVFEPEWHQGMSGVLEMTHVMCDTFIIITSPNVLNQRVEKTWKSYNPNMSNKCILCPDKRQASKDGLWWRRGGLWVCPLPGNEAVSKVYNLFMFPSSHFVRRIDPKPLFLRPYHGSQRGRPNLILRSSNIPQSNITRLRSYHIQRERTIFFHHSSLLSLFQSNPNAGLFFHSLPRLPSLIGQNERTSVKCWRSVSLWGRWLI